MHLAITQQAVISHFSAFLGGVICSILFLLLCALVDWLRESRSDTDTDTEDPPVHIDEWRDPPCNVPDI